MYPLTLPSVRVGFYRVSTDFTKSATHLYAALRVPASLSARSLTTSLCGARHQRPHHITVDEHKREVGHCGKNTTSFTSSCTKVKVLLL